MTLAHVPPGDGIPGDRVVGFAPPQTGRLESVPDLDPLHRLNAHHRGGEETVETSPAPTPSAEPTPTAPPETPPRVEPDTVDALDEILDAEIVDTNPRPDVETEPSTDPRADVEGSPAPDRTSIAATRGRARAAVERVKALGQYAELVDAMREREIPTAQSRWTGEQCAVVLGLAEKLAAQADTTGGDQ